MRRIVLAALLLAAATPARAQDELDELLGGFDEAPVEVASPDSAARLLPPWLDAGGELLLLATANLDEPAPAGASPGAPPPARGDHRGLGHLRATLRLSLDAALPRGWKARASGVGMGDLAPALKGRGDYEEAYLESMEAEVELDELWLQGSAGRLDLKLGRQLLVWGMADQLRAVDVLNPQDRREPGLVDLADLKLPVTMTRLDLRLGRWTLGGALVHEIRRDKEPAWGSEFYPLDMPPPPAEKPASEADNTEWGLSLKGTAGKWDLGAYAARVFEDGGHVEMTPAGPARRFARVDMLGAAFAWTRGSWLARGEAARLEGVRVAAAPLDEQRRLDLVLGLEYSGFSETSLALEVADRRLLDWDPAWAAAADDPVEHDWQLAARASRDFLHDRLTVMALVMGFGLADDPAGALRLQADWEWKGGLILTPGLVLYRSGDRFPTTDLGDHDRAFCRLSWNF